MDVSETLAESFVFVDLEQVDRMSLYIYPPLSLVLTDIVGFVIRCVCFTAR